MVLVVFVIMLLNLEDDRPLNRLRYLYVLGGGLGVVLLAQTLFIFYVVLRTPNTAVDQTMSPGKTLSIGRAMYTEYLLPVEIVGVLLMMAVIGGVMLARRFVQPPLDVVAGNDLEQPKQD
jgi:NAD(P)H-quinone oxidoreductase subunit 6